MSERLAQQIAIYGSPLSERFAALRGYYSISQRQLAQVLGISAPMLSQLSTGARIKFGNPSVFERMLLLEELASQGAPPAEGLARVTAATDATDTARETARLRHTTGRETAHTSGAPLGASIRQVPAEELRTALERTVDLPQLHAALRAALDDLAAEAT